MRKLIIKRLGGYTDLDDALKDNKEEVLTRAVSKLYNTIEADDVFSVKNQNWTYEGKPINDSLRTKIIGEAIVFQKSTLWKMMQTEVKYHANKKMYLESRDQFDLILGKSWTYVLDIMKSVLDRVIKFSK